MATIENRSKDRNQWRVKIRRKGPDGQPIRRSRTFDSYEDAKRWADIVEGRISGDEYADTKRERRTTLRHLLERYEREVSPKKKGHKQEVYRLRQWAAEPFAAWSLPALRSPTIGKWMDAQTEAGKAPSTVSNAVNLLSAVYSVAISKWGYRVDNPCEGLPRPKARPARQARLAAEEEKKLLDACTSGPRWLVWVVQLQLLTAMRQSEIRRLRWEHIHDTHIHLPETKNDTERDVPLTAAALAVVSEMKKALSRRVDGYVFGDPNPPTARAGGFTKDMVSQAYRDAARKAGLKLSNHDLRHIAITRLADLHDNVLELSATTGHKTLGVLKRYYNPTPEDRAAKLREREAKLRREKARRRAA
jgi:integrase